MKQQACGYSLIIVCWCSVWFAGSAFGGIVSVEPDNFPQNTAIDPSGVEIRIWTESLPPNLSVWDDTSHKLYAYDPLGWLGMQASTGQLVYGYHAPANPKVGTLIAGLHVLFDSPTNFVGFDLVWPMASWSEGARFKAYSEDSGGNEILVINQVYNPVWSNHTHVAWFYPGITRITIFAHNNPSYNRNQAFGLDALNYIDTNSGSALHLGNGETIVAPEGLTLGSDDSLLGEGTVEGDVNNVGGTVSPGSSAGNIEVTGDYEQNGDSYLLMEIGDGVNDHLLVGGTATLVGTLEIVLLPGFTPEDGASFTLISYGDRKGVFDEILGLNFPGGVFEPTYGPGGFSVMANIPEPATLSLLALGGLAVLCRRRKQ